MKFSAEQLATLSKLSDEWLDLPPPQRAHWCDEAILQHPALAEAIAAMADDSSNSGMVPELTRVPTDQADEAAAFVAGEVLGPYRLVREIGVGGMGVVWLAEQVDGHVTRTVALKLPLHHFAQQGLRSRFARERNILAALDHPNIAKLLDAGVTEAGQPYMAMQYVPGIAITAYCDKQNLDVNARLKLFIELLQAVQHAHSNLVVHRDLKPGNILVTDDSRVMLLDFGIAKLLNIDTPGPSADADTPMTEFAGSALTLDYASPEQVSGKPISTRSDIYSLGVVLYELLTGKRPYRLRRSSKAALEEAVLEQHIQPPSSQTDSKGSERRDATPRALTNLLRGDLDAIVLKALAKSPHNRYATADAFSEDLQRWLRKEPVSAQRDKWTYRAHRLWARRWRLISASVFVALALITTAAVAVLQAAEAKRATQAAQSETRKAQAVTTFLKDLFNTNTLNQADPAAARKRTAEQLLDEGTKRIKDSLKDAPEQQIELLHTMIELYSSSPKFENILALAQQSMQIAKATYGARDPRALSEVANFAEKAIAYGRIDVGEAALTEVLPEIPRLVASHEENVRSAGANVLRVQLFFEESYRVKKSLFTARQAEKVYATLPVSEFSYGRHHALGIAYLANFAFDEAEQHFKESNRLLALSGDLNGGPYPTRYGQLLALTGRYSEAESKFQTGLGAERQDEALKAKHLNEKALTIYSSFLSDTSRGVKALALAVAGTPDSVLSPQNASKSCEQFMLAKGQALIRIGLIESGLKCLDTWDAEMVDAKLTTIATSWARLRGMLELGRLEDAHLLLDKMGNLLESKEALATNDSRQYWHHRVAWLLAANKTTEAQVAFEQARSTLAPPGVGVIERVMTTCLEASIEQKEGNHSGARQRLEAGIELVAKSPDRALLLEWQSRLEELRGVSLATLGQPAEAQRSLEAALQINKAIFDPKASISVGRVALRLAGLHKTAGRTAVAKAYQAQADAIRRTHPLFEQWVL